MKFYDLFAGIGGFRLGLERIGFKCIGSCEIDKYAREIYRKNFGEYPTEKDVRLLEPSRLKDFDMLTAGFPCQSFSVAGNEKGFDDERGNLFFEIVKIAKEKKPSYLLLENVKGLLSNDRGRTFMRILYELDEIGYDIQWQTINGKYFVPQQRERVFIIGSLREKSFRKIFSIRENNKMDKEQINRKQEKQIVVNCIDSNYWKGLDKHGQRTMILFNNKLRKLTPLECERLMGFPDNWTKLDGISDTQRYKMLGNSLIPQIIEMLGNNIKNNSYN